MKSIIHLDGRNCYFAHTVNGMVFMCDSEDYCIAQVRKVSYQKALEEARNLEEHPDFVCEGEESADFFESEEAFFAEVGTQPG